MGPATTAKGLKAHTTHRQLPQQDTYRRYTSSRCHAPPWGSRPERRDVKRSQNFNPQDRRDSSALLAVLEKQILAIVFSFSTAQLFQSRTLLQSVNSHRSERPTLPEEYVVRSSECVFRCHHKLVSFLKDKQVC